MDDDRPINQFIGFLKLMAALLVIILSGVALVVGLTWYLSPAQPEEINAVTFGDIKRLPAYEPEPVVPDANIPLDLLDAELAEVQVEYQDAKAELERALTEKHAGDPPIGEDLGIVEGAIVEIVSALTLNPENENLRRTLMATYQRQVRLLRKSIEIADERIAPEASDLP